MSNAHVHFARIKVSDCLVVSVYKEYDAQVSICVRNEICAA